MIVHVALFAWKPGTRKETIRELMSRVQSLETKVPGVLQIHCGENFSKWNDGFSHAFVVVTESKEALDAYRNHPDHVKVATEIDSIESKSIGVDFEG